MGDAQSAQRDDKKDAAAEESGQVEDARTEQNIEDKPLKNNGQISEINGKVDGSIAEVNGACEDKIAAEAILPPGEAVSDTQKTQKIEEETRLESVEINEKESTDEADTNEDVLTEMDAKQNNINEGFKKFFSNIGLKLTVKRGSGEIPIDVPDETNEEEPNRSAGVEDTAKETECESAEQNTDLKTAPETYDNDSTTCPTLTDATSEDILENVAEKTIDTKEEAESDTAEAQTTSPEGEETPPDATPEEEPQPTSPSSPEEVVSPIKRFFTTGIFSGLRKKKKVSGEQVADKELVDMGKREAEEIGQTAQVDKDEIGEGAVVVVETQQKENELKEEILSAASAQTTDEGKSPTTDPSTTTASEQEMLNSLEREKVQASPLRRLLSGSSLKRLSKKPRSSKSSDAKLSDSGEHVSDHLQSSTESAEKKEEEKSPAQAPAESTPEEEGAWASFKKLMTPKRRVKRPNDEVQIPAEEPKPSETEQISDHSTEEGKKRKDSSVSWEAVLCGSGRRRSRKTSDSEEETPENKGKKEDGGSKQVESQLESSNEIDNEIIASSPRKEENPSDGDAGSTWKSLKRLVTPKRKAKGDDEGKDNVQSDSEVSQDEPSFSIKKILPGRKKRKSADKHDQVSSDEADKDVASGDEDSETPAVVPLSEFDAPETEVQIQTQADVENRIPEEVGHEFQQDLNDQIPEPDQPCENLQMKVEKVQESVEASKKPTKPPTIDEEPDDLTESISKHKQLSDIPEEGAITDTMVTPASAKEEVFRDDTIAEDLIEITSEAVTAPEPVDTALTDETEMISAVSQLSSESSKTSGNTTPVPAEDNVQETDALLNQVVETIADEVGSERIDGSDLHAGLKLEELDGSNELAVTAQTESTSEVSTEIISEVPTEDFDHAEISPDEEHEVKATHTEDSFKELETIDGSLHQVDSLSAVCSAVISDEVPEDTELTTDESFLVEANQNEREQQKSDGLKGPTVADETKDEAMGQEVQTVTAKEDQMMGNVTDQIQLKDEDHATKEMEELQDSATAATDSEKIVEKEVTPESLPAAETVPDECKEESLIGVDVSDKDKELETDAVKTEDAQEELESVKILLDSEVCSDLSPNEDISPAETATDEPKQAKEGSAEPESKELPDQALISESETPQPVQVSLLDSEEGLFEKEAISEDVQKEGTFIDEPKEEAVLLPEVDTVPVQQPDLLLDGQATANEQPSEKDETPEEPSEAEKPMVEPTEESVPIPEVVIEQEDATKTDHVQEPTIDLQKGSEKEVISEEHPEAMPVKEETMPLPEDNVEQSDDTKLCQELEEIQAVQEPTSDLEKSSEQSCEKDVISEKLSEVETAVEQSVPLPDSNIEQDDATTKIDNVQEPVEIQTVEEPALHLEIANTQLTEKEEQPIVQTVIDEPKEDAVPLPEVVIEQEDATKTDRVQEPEVVQAVQEPTIDLQKASEKELISEEPPEAMPVKEETMPLPGDNTEQSDDTTLCQELEETQAVQEPTLDLEKSSEQSCEKDVLSEKLPEVETAVEQSVPLPDSNIEQDDASTKTDDVQEPALDLEKANPQLIEKEEQPIVETVIDEPKEDAVPLPNASIEPEEKVQVEEEHVQEGVMSDGDKPIASVSSIGEDIAEQKAESIPEDVQVEQVDHISETIDELQTTTAVCVPIITEEECNLEVREKVVFPDETQAPPLDQAGAMDEPSHEVNLSVAQVYVEEEKESELQGTEIKTAAVEHDVAAHVAMSTLKEALAAITDAEIQKTENIHEPLIDRMESELVIEEGVQTVVPLVTDDVRETAVGGSDVVIKQVSLVEFEDIHRVQAQVFNVDTKLAETIVETVLEVGATETKEVIDVCHETVRKVDNLSATPVVEEEVINEDNKVVSQESTLHVKDNLPETALEEGMKQPDASAEVCELVKSESNEAEDQKLMEDCTEIEEKLEEVSHQEMSQDLIQTDLSESVKASTIDHKMDLDETEVEQSESGVTAEVKPLSEEFIEQTSITQTAQTQFITASNAGLVIPQNSGIISSIGNVESPASLSLEFKLNIQFGQAKAPSSLPPATERVEPVKPTDVSEVSVQAKEPAKPEKPTQKSESQTQTEIMEVTIQTTEMKEPLATTDSETAPIPDQPLLLDVSMEMDKTEELDEQNKPAETVTSSVNATETMQAEKSEVILSQPVLSSLAESEGKTAEEPVKLIEEENEQDVWLDAEEGIYTQEETKMEELPERQMESEQEEKAALEHEVIFAPNLNTEEEKSDKTAEMIEIESDGEDFAVALEHPEPATASITTMEWD